MLRVKDTGRTDKRKLLGLSACAEFQCVNGTQDVGRLESGIRIHPVNECPVVEHGIDALGEVVPYGL